MIDAQGGTVMSGIHDGHVHPMYAGLRSLNPSLFDAALTVEELQAALTYYLENPPNEDPDVWLVVESWNPAGLMPPGTVADKTYLDALDTVRPIALRGSDGHNTWVNTRALEIAEITNTAPVLPPGFGGEIVRDPSGEATGLLKDDAQAFVTNVIPPPSEEQQLASFVWAFDQMAAGGITTILDAWVDEWQLDAYAWLAANGHLHQRVNPALLLTPEQIADPKAALAWAQKLAKDYAHVPGLTFGTVKVFMDGVMEFPAQTAALLEPYLDADGNPTDNYGDLYIDSATLGALVEVFDRAGWQVHAHAIGDAAVRAALDGFEIAQAANNRRGPNRQRHTIAHLQLVHPDDYARFAELGVIPDMQLQWATRNVWTLEALEPYLGPERHARMYPANSMLQAGAPLAGGSDWPVDPLFPWNQVQTAIDRIGLYSEDGQPLNADEGISRVESLRMHTSGTAYQLHQEKKTGTLEVGKYADLVILDRDITTSPVDEIATSTPILTMVGGRAVFDADTSAGHRIVRRGRAGKKVAGTLGASRINHGELRGSRHDGCPCTSEGSQPGNRH